ncbi:hypothetical protein PhaeoP30_02269 [Phaeobacter inhibens]|nr:hypothetical protein PhaeoP30_02269 [Phaeobacter inhibens]AUQ63245.1 hypothetical protein PhaeoP51_02277 [Phaeobacter inhibens]AUQ83151.1 hypothetical protein PhaeoP57_02238 [Phaeobacter inhibens]AUQ90910.1 hypothetical protein PhaeoP24_02310 [Phaeobacter inhibens]
MTTLLGMWAESVNSLQLRSDSVVLVKADV